MSGYRCNFLDEQGRILAAENLEADSLDEAIGSALAMLHSQGHHSIELWQGAVRLYASREEQPRHQCHVYEGAPSQTLRTMALLIDRKLRDNVRCLYINSPAMVAGLRSSLAALGVDVAKQVEAGALILSSDDSHLAEGRFDADAMLETLEGAVDAAVSDGYEGLWASGDMTWELGSHRDADELLKYEWRLEEVFRRRAELSGICQYHVDTLPHDLVVHGLAAHRSIFMNETLSRLNPCHVAPFTKDLPQAQLSALIDDICGAGRAAG